MPYIDIFLLGYILNITLFIVLILAGVISALTSIQDPREMERINNRVLYTISNRSTKDKVLRALTYLIPFYIAYICLYKLYMLYLCKGDYESYMNSLMEQNL